MTEMLQRWSDGDEAAGAILLPQLYDDLLRLARSQLRRERADHTLETGALVHEVYFKLLKQKRITWRDRRHFYAIAARLMRQCLVDHARGRNAHRRGGHARKVSLDEALHVNASMPLDLVELDDALHELAKLDPDKAKLVELRFFGGLTVQEIAEILNVSPSTVERQWRAARAWLRRALSS